MGPTKNKIIKDRVRNLRKKGYSVTRISKDLKVAKSNVSLWVRDIVLTKEQYELLSHGSHTQEIIENRRKTRLLNEFTKRRVEIDLASKEIQNLSLENLKLIGIALYWAEGAKSKRNVVFTNSDPSMIKVMLRFFKEVCGVEEDKFRANIHTHSPNNVKLAEKYWSEISGIPLKNFYKTYSKKSASTKNIRKTLPYGTLDIYVNDVKVFLRIMGWIEKIKKLTTE